jgi:hypothetical protein
MPNQPVVVFSESGTFNFPSKDCDIPKPAPKISDEEKQILNLIHTAPMKVVTEFNSDAKMMNPWNAVKDIFKLYKMAGMVLETI